MSFFFRKRIYIFPLECREIPIFQWIFFSVNRNRLFLFINLRKKQAVFHLVFRMAQYRLAFQFQKHNGNCLIGRLHRLHIGIRFFRKQREFPETDAIAAL